MVSPNTAAQGKGLMEVTVVGTLKLSGHQIQQGKEKKRKGEKMKGKKRKKKKTKSNKEKYRRGKKQRKYKEIK